jgi:hypothetical protein
MHSHIPLLQQATKRAIETYAEVAATSENPPEQFISHICAVELHNATSWTIRPELPARECVDRWSLDRNQLLHLNKDFRFDLACFGKPGGELQNLQMLVEFKLWTSIDLIYLDFLRLAEASNLISKKHGEIFSKIGSYIVCTPHYATRKRVDDAIDALKGNSAKLFRKFFFENTDPFETASSSSGLGYASVIVIDVAKCEI